MKSVLRNACLLLLLAVTSSSSTSIPFDKIVELITGPGGGLGGNNAVKKLFSNFQSLLQNDPESAFTSIFQNNVFEGFLGQTVDMKKSLQDVQVQMRTMTEQLKTVQSLLKSNQNPEDIIGELNRLNLGGLVGKAERNTKSLSNFRGDFSQFTTGLANLQKAFQDPESLRRGLVSIMSQAPAETETDTYYETEDTRAPKADRKTRKGQKTVEQLMKLLPGADSASSSASTFDKLKDIMNIFNNLGSRNKRRNRRRL